MSEQEVIDESSESEDELVQPGRIYRLQDSEGKFYIGSTQKTLEQRFRNHRSRSSGAVHGQIPVTLYYGERGWDDVEIILVSEMNCTKAELRRAEGELIKQHIGDPNCHNKNITGRGETKREAHAREYLELGKLVMCECGDFITAGHLDDHRSRPRHAQRLALKILPPPVPSAIEETHECECGLLVKTSSSAAHLTSERHIVKMRLKTFILPDVSLVDPPACATPTGASSRGPCCMCPCGMATVRGEWKTKHLPSLKHKKRMLRLASGEPAEPTIKKPRIEAVAERYREKGLCPCGAQIAIRNLRVHQATERHKFRMIQIAQTTAGPEEEVAAVEQITRITCACWEPILAFVSPQTSRLCNSQEVDGRTGQRSEYNVKSNGAGVVRLRKKSRENGDVDSHKEQIPSVSCCYSTGGGRNESRMKNSCSSEKLVGNRDRLPTFINPQS